VNTNGEPCPSCDNGLWHRGHVCYTYAEWHERIAANNAKAEDA